MSEVPSESRQGLGVTGLCEQHKTDAGIEALISKRAEVTFSFST